MQQPLNGYQYDIFLSYKWRGSVQEWVNKIFFPILVNEIYNLNQDIKIFKDTEDINPGDTLTDSLRYGLITSKILVSIITPPYFVKSQWCTMEFSTLHHRERQLGYRTTQNRGGLIFPVIFVDINQTTQEISHLAHDFAEAYNLAKGFTPLYIDRQQYLYSNGAFKESKEYNNLIQLIRDWLSKGVLLRLHDANVVWKSEFSTPEWIETPYEKFINDYIKNNPPPAIQQPVIK